MNILMVLGESFPPDLRVEKEMKSLNKTGHKIHLACHTTKKEKEIEHTDYCTIHRKQVSTFILKTRIDPFRFPFYFNFWRRFLFKLMENEHFDVIHIHDLPLAKIGHELKQKYNTKLVIDLHENWTSLQESSPYTKSLLGRILFSHTRWVKYEKKVLKYANAVITVVEEMKNRIVRLGLMPEKIHVISNTIDLEKINTLQKATNNKNTINLRNTNNLQQIANNKNPITLIYAGGITYHRGIQYVIRSILILNQKSIDVKLKVIGEGSYKKELIRLVKKLNVENQVCFLGRKSHNESLTHISKANYALIPHIKYEQTDNSSPNKLFEYIAMGIPIICSNCSSLERIIKETKSGAIYQYDSPSDFAQKLIQIEEDRKNIIDLELAKKKIETKYNWNVDEQILYNMYKLI